MKNIFYIIFIILIIFTIKFYYSGYIIAFYDKQSNIIIYNNKKFYFTSIETKINEKSFIENNKINSPNKIKQPKLNSIKSDEDLSLFEYIFYISATILLTVFAGMMSGLTVGFMGINSMVLEIEQKNGTEKQKKTAKRILNVLSKHHWLLVTLLVCNSFAAETMPIVLSKLINEVYSIMVSVILLLIIGEIIPMALCTGPKQMKLVSCFYPLVYFLMLVTFVISKPFALLMDKVIGKQETTRFSNDEIKEFIKLHDKSNFKDNLKPGLGLNQIQIKIIENVIDLSEKKIIDIIKNYNVLKKFEKNDEITEEKIKNIHLNHQEIIPIFEDNINNIIGVLNSIELLNTEKKNTFNDLKLNKPLMINEKNDIFDILEKLITNEQNISFIIKDINIENFNQKNENEQESLINQTNSISQNDENNNSEIKKNMKKIEGIIYLNDILNCFINNIKNDNRNTIIKNENDMVLIIKEN